MIPYFVFGFFIANFVYVTEGFINFKSYIKFLISFNNNDSALLITPYWFLTAFFISNILYYLINKYLHNRVKVLFIVNLSLFANLNGIYKFIKFPFSANASLVGLSLYLIGSYLRKCEIKKSQISNIFNLNIITCIILITTVFLISQFNSVSMRQNIYQNIPLFWLNAVLGYVMIINLSKQILKVLKFLNLNILINWLAFIGKNSIIFVCFNYLIIYMLDYKIFINPYLNIPSTLELLSVLLIITLISYMISKSKLRFIIGK